MKNRFLKKISDISNLHRRAAFSDLPDRLPAKESVFQALAKERYSCRQFKDTPLTDVQINHILEAARVAPTAANRQPVHVWVVKSPEALEKLKGATDYTYGAPVVFMVGAKPDFPETADYEMVCLFPVGHAAAEAGANHAKRQEMDIFASEL